MTNIIKPNARWHYRLEVAKKFIEESWVLDDWFSTFAETLSPESPEEFKELLQIKSDLETILKFNHKNILTKEQRGELEYILHEIINEIISEVKWAARYIL